ncbi:protein phosphatase 2C domain-containing protein [Ditylenchus destructor]|nr:protein phosphatase 2C domain-containing protein [Ditylenchus destructor]
MAKHIPSSVLKRSSFSLYDDDEAGPKSSSDENVNKKPKFSAIGQINNENLSALNQSAESSNVESKIVEDGKNVQQTTNDDSTASDHTIKPGNSAANTEIVEPSKADSVSTNAVLSAYSSRKGERDEMQDRHVIVESFALLEQSSSDAVVDIKSQNLVRSAFFALFDGHGGKLASEFCANHFAVRLSAACIKYSMPAKDVASVERSMKKIFTDTYKAIDDEFLKEARRQRPPLKDGSTATTILLINDVLYCANIGDSKAVVCRYKTETKETVAMQITIDHSPIHFNERMRIQKAGGIVKDGRVMGVLEVSRSIGDGQYKSHGVTCLPDIKKLTLTTEDLFIILACDGLWKCFSNEEAIKFALAKYQSIHPKNDKETTQNTDEWMRNAWTKIADDMTADAILRGCGDNVSVVIVVLKENMHKHFNM